MVQKPSQLSILSYRSGLSGLKMKHIPFRKIIARNLKKLLKYLRLVTKDFEFDDIHQFRIQYKKLRAFLKCAQVLSSKTYVVRKWKRLKKIYKILGTFRDIQLQQQRILKETSARHGVPYDYYNLLENKNKWVEEGCRSIDISDLNKAEYRTIKNIRQHVISSSGKELYFKDSVRNKIKLDKPERLNDEDIHQVRKMLRDMVLLYKIIIHYKNVESYYLNEYKKRKKYFAGLLRTLGKFQDLCVAIRLADETHQVPLSQSSREFLSHQRSLWLKDKAELKAIILRNISKGISLNSA